MNLDKAIKIKLIWKDSGYAPPGPNEINADDISIEALKQIKQIRAYAKKLYLPILPGETKD